MVQPLWRTVCRFLRKLKIKLPYDLSVPLLGIYPEKLLIQKEPCGHLHALVRRGTGCGRAPAVVKKKKQKEPCIPMFIAALFAIAKT